MEHDPMTTRHDVTPDLIARLERIGQSHVLRFADALSPAARQALVQQIEAIDLEEIPGLLDTYVKQKPTFALPADVAPAPYYPNDPGSSIRRWDRECARAEGEALLRGGKVACFTVAGGDEEAVVSALCGADSGSGKAVWSGDPLVHHDEPAES
jgi:hypothetical protein